MPEPLAIKLENVSKVYRLYGSQRAQLLDVIGLTKFGFGPSAATKEFVALKDITLDVPRGKRIGIVGRNGAGKTTLLKLICGNFAPTSGSISVKGRVQALLSIGLGFHPDHTGRENVNASLQYNGLSRSEYQPAMEEIIDFCELGQFIDQPFKTYSLGMQGRLMFAAATAIRPDILIVDEVLGAGDGYFVAKSRLRVERLVNSGCTMLLVSHSTQQVLELCDHAIWLDQGHIRMQGDAFDVVKTYEEFLHGPISGLRELDDQSSRGPVIAQSVKRHRIEAISLRPDRLLQDPRFLPHEHHSSFAIPKNVDLFTFHFQTSGGVSKWAAETGLKVQGFCIVTPNGLTNKLICFQPATFLFPIVAERNEDFRYRAGIAIFNLSGAVATRIWSPVLEASLLKGDAVLVAATLNPVQLGPGFYVVGVSIIGDGPIENVNAASRFDLVSRSFELEVELPDSLGALKGSMFHTAEWTVSALADQWQEAESNVASEG